MSSLVVSSILSSIAFVGMTGVMMSVYRLLLRQVCRITIEYITAEEKEFFFYAKQVIKTISWQSSQSCKQIVHEEKE